MHAIPDELLELILLHVASAICLIRSASVCKRWLAHCAVDGIECAYLADGEEGGGNGFLLNFRLVVLLNICGYDHGCGRRLHAAVLTPGPGGGSWEKVCIEEQQMSLMGLTKGCVLYWYAGGRTVVALDRSTAEISSFALSGSIEAWHSFHADSTAVAAGRDGEPRVVTVAGAGGHLKVFSRLQGGNGGAGGEWALEKSVPLSEAMRSLTECDRSLLRSRTFTFAHNNEGKLLLRVHAGTVLPCLYHLDVETVELESVDDYGLAYPCELPWPPALHAFNLH
ncbi:unnamed protein product [Urochloa humidicola]